MNVTYPKNTYPTIPDRQKNNCECKPDEPIEPTEPVAIAFKLKQSSVENQNPLVSAVFTDWALDLQVIMSDGTLVAAPEDVEVVSTTINLSELAGDLELDAGQACGVANINSPSLGLTGVIVVSVASFAE